MGSVGGSAGGQSHLSHLVIGDDVEGAIELDVRAHFEHYPDLVLRNVQPFLQGDGPLGAQRARHHNKARPLVSVACA